MGKLKRQVTNLLNSIQFIDLAQAVNQPRSERKDWLRRYVFRRLDKKGRFSSYAPFRNAIGTIYGVTRGLDPKPQMEWEEFEPYLIKSCAGKDVDMNVSAGRALFDLVRCPENAAYDYPAQALPLGQKRFAVIGLRHYIVRDEEAIFQFPYPRRSRLSDQDYELMMSLIHYAYAQGDYANAQIEVADLSCVGSGKRKGLSDESGPRDPRIIRLAQSRLISKHDLELEVQNVHELLLEIAEEPDPT